MRLSQMSELYLGKDLEAYVEDEQVAEKHPRRGDLVRGLLPDSATINIYSSGGYQGMMGFAIDLDDHIWLIKESYGSCSYCDGLIGSGDRISYGISMLRNAYCFESIDDAVEFVDDASDNDDGYYGWDRISGGLIDELQKLSEEN